VLSRREIAPTDRNSQDNKLLALLKETDRYAKSLQCEEKENQRRGGIWYLGFVLLFALLGFGLVLISH
jgi:hypothetical protein